MTADLCTKIRRPEFLPASACFKRVGLVGGCRVRRSRRSRAAPVAGKPREKWSHFKRHLVPGRGNCHRRSLDQLDIVIPGVELYASAQRQRRNLVQFVGLQGRRRGHQLRHSFHSASGVGKTVSQVGRQQGGKRWTSLSQLTQEQPCGIQLLCIRRVLQQVDRFLVGGDLFLRNVPESQVLVS